MDWYPKRRFGDLADEIADRLPDAEGLVFEEARYTFRQVAQRINDAAKRLIAAGVGLGDHVALWLNNCDAWIFVAFAVHKIGAVLVPINTRFRAREMAYVLRQSDARFLIIEERSGSIDYLAMVRDAVSLPKTATRCVTPRFPSCARSSCSTRKRRPAPSHGRRWRRPPLRRPTARSPHAPALSIPMRRPFIMYTSGTTGFPKGAVHSHKLIRNVEERTCRMAITHNNVILNYLPLFHAFGYASVNLRTSPTRVLAYDPALVRAGSRGIGRANER